MSAPVTFTKKVAASDMKLAATWWTRRGSNPRPPRCERGALPAEPRALGCRHILQKNQHVLLYGVNADL